MASSKKNFFFYLHSVSGLISGLFILALSLSGAALVFHDELDSFQRPTVVSVKDKGILSIDSCYIIVQQHYPNAQISNASISYSIAQPFSFSIYDSAYQNGNALQLFIHPQTGEILKARGGSDDARHNIMSWLSKFHNSFQMGKKGEWLLGVFALFFLLSIITGLIIYRRNILPALFFRKSVWKKNNLHQLIGVWALLFNLMIAITGFWMQRYVFKKEFYSSSSWANTIKASPKLLYSFDSAYNRLKQQHPDFTGYVIYFAQSTKGKTAIYGGRSGNSFIHSKQFADAVMLDSTGNIASTRFIDTISADDRYDIINSQLHFGKYGGLPVKIIYSLFGCSSAVLSITGFILWRRKKFSRR
jgi:uncharacterized iron-regulated membrane protein